MSTETRAAHDLDVTTQRYRAAVERRDVEGVVGVLSEDAVMYSPISALARFEGPAAIREVLGVVFERITAPSCVAEIGGGSDQRALVVRSTVRGVEMEEAVWLRFDADGLINELTLFIRPAAALTALMAAIGPPLAARQSLGGGIVAAAMTRPLAALVRHGDPLAVRLAGVGRR